MNAYPGDWLFEYSVLKWLFEPELKRQLPPPLRVFSWYAWLYFKTTQANQLKAGRRILLALRTVYRLSPKREYLRLRLPPGEVYLDLENPRFLGVVSELNTPVIPRILSTLLSKGDTFIDVGANHGSFSLVASGLVGPNGYIVSIEPQHRLASVIERTLGSNAACPFQVCQMALGNADGEVDFFIPDDTTGSAGVFRSHSATHRYRSVRVPMKRFDAAVNWRALPGKIVLKVDVEGSEYDFLMGARKMITERAPTLILEIHPGTLKASGRTGDALMQLLAELGYRCYAEQESPRESFSLESLDTSRQRDVILWQTAREQA